MKQLCVRVIALILIITSVQFETSEVSAKSVSRIVIPTTYAKQDSGHARILKLDVVYSDGSVERITKGVTWSSTTKKVARVGKETVVAGVPGKTTLTATYKGKKTSRVINVSIPAKQSDVNWLKLHQAAIFYDGNFYGNSVKLGTDLRKVKGTIGGIGKPYSDDNSPGKWTGLFLNTYSTANKINPNYTTVSALSTPKLFNRTVTATEVEKALGTTPYILLANEEYGYGFVYQFHKDGKKILSFKQTTLRSYVINNRTLNLDFDENDVLRAMSISEKYIPAYGIETR